MGTGMKRGVDLAEEQGERERERGGNKADYSEATNRAELRGRTFHKDGVKRPAKCGGEGDEQSGQGNMSIVQAVTGLEPDDAESADQTEQGAELKLPLANDVALFRKKCECKQGGEDYG